jgi:CBS domain-containing protein
MTMLKAKDVMTPDPQFIAAEATLDEAARKMRAIGCGSLPVGDSRKFKGIITDRDIVIRALAHGRNPAHAIVADYMTAEVFACRDDDTLEAAVEKMRDHKVSRLLVRDRAGDVVGILSFGGIMRKGASVADMVGVIERAATRSVA